MYHVNINTSYETVRCGYLSDWSPRAGWAEVSLAAHEGVDLFVLPASGCVSPPSTGRMPFPPLLSSLQVLVRERAVLSLFPTHPC